MAENSKKGDALLSSQLIRNAQLRIYGICSTRKDEVNAELLAFFEA